MAFLMSYVANSSEEKPHEVKYNTARAYHYLGMNTHAQQLYEELINDESVQVNSDLMIRARFNLAQLLKGSGVSYGMRVRGMADSTSN